MAKLIRSLKEHEDVTTTKRTRSSLYDILMGRANDDEEKENRNKNGEPKYGYCGDGITIANGPYHQGCQSK